MAIRGNYMEKASTTILFLFERDERELADDPEYQDIQAEIAGANRDNRELAERLKKYGVKLNISEL